MKKVMVRSQLIGVLAAFAFYSQNVTAQPAHYNITDLGVVGPAGQPFFVTNNGLVSGSAAVTSGAYHAVFWYGGLETDIGASGFGGPNSMALGVNVRAQVVGFSEASEPEPYGEDFCGNGTHLVCLPFIWQFGLMSPLPTLGGRNGTANMVNSRGQAVGFAENAAWDPSCPAPQKYQFKPVLWTNGTAQQLATVAGDQEGLAWAVNENGQAAGGSGSCAAYNPIWGNNLQPLHALLWDNGGMTDLGNLGGTGHGNGIFAKNLNNNGQVVGASDLPGDKTFHAFLWTKSAGIQDLGTLPGDVASAGLAINDAGVVLGVSLDDQFNPRAFIWQGGVMADLNALIPADSSLFLWTGCSINSRGQIIGIASTSNGDIHGYLATPVAATSAGANSSFQPGAQAESRTRRVADGVHKLLPGLRLH